MIARVLSKNEKTMTFVYKKVVFTKYLLPPSSAFWQNMVKRNGNLS